MHKLGYPNLDWDAQMQVWCQIMVLQKKSCLGQSKYRFWHWIISNSEKYPNWDTTIYWM